MLSDPTLTTKTVRGARAALALAAACGSALTAVQAAGWPQLQHDAGRSGRSPERLAPPYRVAWHRDMLAEKGERVYNATQAVVDSGRLYFGTKMGRFHCLDAGTGLTLWEADLDGPVLHTAGTEGGRVFTATLSGSVYALDGRSGATLWRFTNGRRTGFSAAVLLAEGAVFIGDRTGVFYALAQEDGAERWRVKVPGPIFQPAAYEKVGGSGRVLFGAENMRLYALDSATGAMAWESEQVYGQSFRDYPPVLAGGKVFVNAMMLISDFRYGAYSRPGGYPFDTWRFTEEELAPWRPYFREGKMPDVWVKAQEGAADFYLEKPWYQYFYAFDAETGTQPYIVPQWRIGSMNGLNGPPAVRADGKPVTYFSFQGTQLGVLNPATGRFEELLLDAYAERITSGAPDENENVSLAGDVAIHLHTSGHGNASRAYDFRTRRWHAVPQIGWPDNKSRNPYRYYFAVNTQGDANNAAAVADGHFYHFQKHVLVAWTTAGEDKQ